jgi:DNA-binding CsgD family transcriptional regulator
MDIRMKENVSNDPGSNVIKIQGINFSPRELDVMACIMNGRTSKKAIATTLQINPGTAAAHNRNIMQKLNCSSWEHIRDFIERSGQAEFIKQHLKRVLAREHFDLLLHQIADQLIGTVTPVCQIVYDPAESDVLLPIVHRIEDVLKRVGISIKQTVDQKVLSTPSTSNARIIHLSQKRTGSDIITIANYSTSEALMIKVLEAVIGKGL